MKKVRALASERDLVTEVLYEGGSHALMVRWLGGHLRFRPQGTGDLGARMNKAISSSFRSGMQKVVLVGADCPAWTPDTLRRALDGLADHDLVLGPATDGGYYLIGMRKHFPDVFSDIAWGTAEVLSRTLEIARGLNLSVLLLEALNDVDRPEDIRVWQRLRDAESPMTAAQDTSLADPSPTVSGNTDTLLSHSKLARISVVIPVLNERDHIGPTVARVYTNRNVEVIVVDGGSCDGTAEIARSLGCRVLVSHSGRAAQMNLGAHEATGGILLFLHADTLLPRGWAEQVRKCIRTTGTVGGAFLFRPATEFPGSTLMERLVNLRSRWQQMPYGDQALFVRRDVFHELGGFADVPVMEDFDFVRRLKRLGKVRIVPLPAVTSSRRWKRSGVLRTTLIHQALVIAYVFGAPAAVMTRLLELRNGSPFPGPRSETAKGLDDNSQIKEP